MSVIRLLGGVLLASGGALAGVAGRSELRREIRQARAFADALGYLELEIGQRRAALPPAFCSLAKSGPNEARDFFGALCRELDASGLACAWLETVNGAQLAEQVRVCLEPLAQVLGRCESDVQQRELSAARLALTEAERAAAQREHEKGRVLPGLGLALGSMLAVILL